MRERSPGGWPPGRTGSAAAVAAGWFVTLGLRFVIPALLPQIKETVGVGNAGAGLAVTVIWLTYAGMQLPAGVLIDRVGERFLLTASLLLAGASMLVFFLPTYLLFLVAAAVFGLGSGLFGPPRGTVLSRTFRENDAAAFGATLAAGSIGAAALPFVATAISVRTDGLVAGLAGWQVAIGCFTPLFFLLALGVWWALPSGGRPSTGGNTEAAADGGQSGAGRTLRAVIDAATQRRIAIATLGAMFMLFSFQGLTAFYTTYLIDQKGLTSATASALFGVLFLSGAVFQTSIGRAADRYGKRTTLIAIALVSVPPLIALPFVDGTVGLALVTVFIGVRLAFGPVVNSYVVAALPPSVQGTTWGLVRTVFFVIGSLGSAAVGVVADAGMFDAAVLGLAALTAPAIVIFFSLPAESAQPK